MNMIVGGNGWKRKVNKMNESGWKGMEMDWMKVDEMDENRWKWKIFMKTVKNEKKG